MKELSKIKVEKKHLRCLKCGKTMWTTPSKRICKKCKRGWDNIYERDAVNLGIPEPFQCN